MKTKKHNVSLYCVTFARGLYTRVMKCETLDEILKRIENEDRVRGNFHIYKLIHVIPHSDIPKSLKDVDVDISFVSINSDKSLYTQKTDFNKLQ